MSLVIWGLGATSFSQCIRRSIKTWINDNYDFRKLWLYLQRQIQQKLEDTIGGTEDAKK